MNEAAINASLFIEAFYDACDELEGRHPEMEMPGVGRINRILGDAGSGIQINRPKLIPTHEHVSEYHPLAVSKQIVLSREGSFRSLCLCTILCIISTAHPR